MDEALAAVELTDAADRYPAEISGGMQKRAGLARAIVRRNDIILYDEPTSGLDPVTSVTINNLIRRLNKERGITSIVVTHDLQGALLFVDRVLMLKDGPVVEVSEPAEFMKSTNPDVREFLDAQLITPDITNHRTSTLATFTRRFPKSMLTGETVFHKGRASRPAEPLVTCPSRRFVASQAASALDTA